MLYIIHTLSYYHVKKVHSSRVGNQFSLFRKKAEKVVTQNSHVVIRKASAILFKKSDKKSSKIQTEKFFSCCATS